VVKDWLHKRIDDNRKKFLESFTAVAAEQASEREILSMQAERDWDDYKMAEFMEDKIGEEFEAFVASVTNFGLFVQLDNLVEGLVHVRELADDYYVLDEVNYVLRGKRTGTEYSIGDKMRVKLVRVNKDLGQVDFVPVVEEKKDEEKKKPQETIKDKKKTEIKDNWKKKRRNKKKIRPEDV